MDRIDLIVLGKQPFRESGLLLDTFSADLGRFRCVAHGAEKIGGKNFPAIDLFKELQAVCTVREDADLHTLREWEVTGDYTSVASNPRHYVFCARVGSFLLKNSRPGEPLPFTYDALKSLLLQLSAPEPGPDFWTLEQSAVVIKMTFLYENGLLPDSEDPRQNALQEAIVGAGVEGQRLPGLPPEYYKSLNSWLDDLITYHRLNR